MSVRISIAKTLFLFCYLIVGTAGNEVRANTVFDLLSNRSASKFCEDDACDTLDWMDEGCDACDRAPPEMRCEKCSRKRTTCCGLGYWHEPADNCIDRFLPRANTCLPLLQSLVEGRDVTLPLPYGASFISTELDRTVEVSDIRLGLGTDRPTSVNRIEVPQQNFHASTQIFRFDLWTLPCLNVYGIVGRTRTTGDVTVTVNRFPFPGSPPISITAPVDLSGATAGFGATAGLGGKNWFAILDVNKTWTDFTTLDSSLDALVVSPRLGVPIDRHFFKGAAYTGMMWQDTAQTIELTVNHPILGDGLKVEVDQIEPQMWNLLLGGIWAPNERLMFMVEGGMGGRSYVISGVTLRF